jgi:hypothetical protein
MTARAMMARACGNACGAVPFNSGRDPNAPRSQRTARSAGRKAAFLKPAAALSFFAHNRQSVRSGGFRKPDVRLKDAYAASRRLR